jgi:hypothetical protein
MLINKDTLKRLVLVTLAVFLVPVLVCGFLAWSKWVFLLLLS